MTEAEEQGSNPSDATTASDVPSQGDEGPVTAQAAPTAVVTNASSVVGGAPSSQSRVGIKPKKPKFGGFSLNDYGNHVAWCGGEPLPNWSGLKEPNPTTIQAGQKRPTYHSDETKAQKYRREGLKTKYSKDHDLQLF